MRSRPVRGSCGRWDQELPPHQSRSTESARSRDAPFLFPPPPRLFPARPFFPFLTGHESSASANCHSPRFAQVPTGLASAAPVPSPPSPRALAALALPVSAAAPPPPRLPPRTAFVSPPTQRASEAVPTPAPTPPPAHVAPAIHVLSPERWPAGPLRVPARRSNEDKAHGFAGPLEYGAALALGPGKMPVRPIYGHRAAIPHRLRPYPPPPPPPASSTDVSPRARSQPQLQPPQLQPLEDESPSSPASLTGRPLAANLATGPPPTVSSTSDGVEPCLSTYASSQSSLEMAPPSPLPQHPTAVGMRHAQVRDPPQPQTAPRLSGSGTRSERPAGLNDSVGSPSPRPASPLPAPPWRPPPSQRRVLTPVPPTQSSIPASASVSVHRVTFSVAPVIVR